MVLELKPEQEEILEMATRSGRSREEVPYKAFAHIRATLSMDEWMLENRETISAQIEEGFAQAERGELIPDHEAKRSLKERHETSLASHARSL